MDDAERLRQLEQRLADLKARQPAHTPSPTMMMEWDDLEEEISILKESLKKKGSSDEGAA